MNIRDVVSELSKLDPAAQSKAVEAANSMRETNALLTGLGVSKRGPKVGRPRGLPEKAAPVAVVPKGKAKGKASSVLTD